MAAGPGVSMNKSDKAPQDDHHDVALQEKHPGEPHADEDTTSPDSHSGREFSSLDDALADFIVPAENHPIVHHLCEHIGIERYVLVESRAYLKAIRREAGPILRIHFGYTNGFVTEEEARLAAGSDTNPWESDREPALWGIDHPENRIGQGGGGPAKVQVEYGICPVHHLALPASGVCEC